ncbi:MAG: FprA family A-type flavoprotein [Tissierellales bacterium]|nr:FprA family A-type flavoprotein [Tissierellales bacterium]
MNIVKLENGITKLSASLDGILFEGMWEIPNGVSLNSYIVKGEKTAIIDGFCDWDGVPELLFELLKEADVKIEDISYLIINHMEPDHSGWINDFKKLNTNFEVICTKKAASMIKAFYGLEENVRVVKNGDILDLGDGKVLEFHEVPNVHWPETMITLEKSTGIAFTCDLFGTFGKTKYDFDDDLTEKDLNYLDDEGLRYYSNVMMTFTSQVKKAIEKYESLDAKIVAPSHGIVWRNNPNKIVEMYKNYVDYALGYGRKEITILWGSMYGRTETAVREIEKYIESRDIKVNVCRLPQTNWGTVLKSVLSSSGVIIAAPTYEYQMFPPVACALEEIGRKKILKRHAFALGSYGWANGLQKEIDDIVSRFKLNWDFVDTYIFNGKVREEDLDVIRKRVDALINKI